MYIPDNYDAFDSYERENHRLNSYYKDRDEDDYNNEDEGDEE